MLALLLCFCGVQAVQAETPTVAPQGSAIKVFKVERRSTLLDDGKWKQLLTESPITLPTSQVIPKAPRISASGRHHRCEKFPNLPYVYPGCDGEACGMLKYPKAIAPAKLYAEPSEQSKVVDELRRCDPILSFEPHLVLKKFGVARAVVPDEVMSKKAVQAGDLLEVFMSEGEGYYRACIGKDEFSVEGADETTKRPGSVVIVSEAVNENWIRLKSPRGELGYAKGYGFFVGYYDDPPQDDCR